MTNSFYTKTGSPSPNSPGSSAQIRNEFDLIYQAFQKMPTLSLASAKKFIAINETGTALTSVNSISGFTGIDATPVGSLTPASGAFTTLSANAGILGNLTGNVVGNLTGNVVGNITASLGTSSFNNVAINGQLDMNGGTAATIVNLSSPVNTGDAATKGYVDSSIANLIDSSPATLDTLNELAAALGDDPNFATSIANQLGGKLSLTGGTMSGQISMGSFKITGLGAPTAGSDATNKTYVDAILGSSVAAATSAGLALNSENAARSYANSASLSASYAGTQASYVSGMEGKINTLNSSIGNINTVASDLAGASFGNDLGLITDPAAGKQGVPDGYLVTIYKNLTPIGNVAASISGVNSVAFNLPSINAVSSNIASIGAVSSNAATINVVAGQIAPVNNVLTVAQKAADITTLAGIASNITSVAGNATNVNAVASNANNINSVSGGLTNINLVAGQITPTNNIVTVAGKATEISTVAANIANVNNVGGNIANVNTVAGIGSNVTTVAGINTSIVNVAGISSSVSTVSGISSSVVIAANNATSISTFASVYQGSKAADPTLRNSGSALQQGDLYFNTSSNNMKVYTGTAWVVAYTSLSGGLIAANNLSDLQNIATARANLGLSDLGSIA